MEEQNVDQWDVKDSMGNYQIVVNKDDVIGELYYIPEDGSFVIDDQLEIYRMRKHQNHYLVRVLHSSQTRSNSMCFGRNSIKIITQRIPFRIDEIADITQTEAVYILYCCLHGFKVISEMLGPVVVEEKMIGVDSNGKVKVWLNQNYSKNYAQSNQKIKTAKDKANQKMVTSIMQAIKIYNLPEDLVIKLRRILSTSMEQHLKVIEAYVKQNRINISSLKLKVRGDQFIKGNLGDSELSQVNNSLNETPLFTIEGIPDPVAQLVQRIFQPKFYGTRQTNKPVLSENNDQQLPFQNTIQRPTSHLPQDQKLTFLFSNNNQKRPTSCQNKPCQQSILPTRQELAKNHLTEQKQLLLKTSPSQKQIEPTEINNVQSVCPSTIAVKPLQNLNNQIDNIPFESKQTNTFQYPFQKQHVIPQQWHNQRPILQQFPQTYHQGYNQQIQDPRLFMPPASTNFIQNKYSLSPQSPYVNPHQNQFYNQPQGVQNNNFTQNYLNFNTHYAQQSNPNPQGFVPHPAYQSNRF